MYVVVSSAHKENNSCIILESCQNCLCKMFDLHPSVQCKKWRNSLMVQKSEKYQPPVNLIQTSTAAYSHLGWIIPLFVSRMMLSREGYSNDASHCTSLLCPVLMVCHTGYNWEEFNGLVSYKSCSTYPCCKSLCLRSLTNLLNFKNSITSYSIIYIVIK